MFCVVTSDYTWYPASAVSDQSVRGAKSPSSPPPQTTSQPSSMLFNGLNKAASDEAERASKEEDFKSLHSSSVGASSNMPGLPKSLPTLPTDPGDNVTSVEVSWSFQKDNEVTAAGSDTSEDTLLEMSKIEDDVNRSLVGSSCDILGNSDKSGGRNGGTPSADAMSATSGHSSVPMNFADSLPPTLTTLMHKNFSMYRLNKAQGCELGVLITKKVWPLPFTRFHSDYFLKTSGVLEAAMRHHCTMFLFETRCLTARKLFLVN